MIHTDIHTHLAGQDEPGCRPMGPPTLDRATTFCHQDCRQIYPRVKTVIFLNFPGHSRDIQPYCHTPSELPCRCDDDRTDNFSP